MSGREEGARCGGVAREAGHAAPPVSHMAERGETEAVAWWGAGREGCGGSDSGRSWLSLAVVAEAVKTEALVVPFAAMTLPAAAGHFVDAALWHDACAYDFVTRSAFFSDKMRLH